MKKESKKKFDVKVDNIGCKNCGKTDGFNINLKKRKSVCRNCNEEVNLDEMIIFMLHINNIKNLELLERIDLLEDKFKKESVYILVNQLVILILSIAVILINFK